MENVMAKDRIGLMYSERYGRLCAYAHKFINDPETCKDIVQDVFLGLYEDDSCFSNAYNKEGYLLSCVKNKCMDLLKREVTKRRYLMKLLYEVTHVKEVEVSELEVKELAEKLEETIKNLPHLTYTIFCKSRLEGKKNAEIAEELGISIKTVEAHISKALKIIRLVVVNISLLIGLLLYFFG